MDRISSCEEAPHDMKIMIVKADLYLKRGRVRPIAIQGEDGSYAGAIECRVNQRSDCPFGRESCSLFKSGFIFDKDVDAIAWAREEIANLDRTTTEEEKRTFKYLLNARLVTPLNRDERG
jgi:hypothetical protein